MLCPNCGKEIADIAKFCAGCGNAIAAAPKETPVSEPVSATASAPKLSAKARGLSKGKFLKTEASASVKKFSLISLVLGLVAVALIFTSVIVPLNTPFYDLAIVTMFVEKDDRDDLKDVFKTVEKEGRDVEDILDECAERLDSDELKKLEKVLNSALDVIEKPSFANINKGIKDISQLTDLGLSEAQMKELGLDDIEEELEEVASGFNMIITIAYVWAGFIALLALLAGAFKRTGLAIVTAIFYAPAAFLLAGPVLAIITTAVFIAIAVFASRVNKAYKKA